MVRILPCLLKQRYLLDDLWRYLTKGRGEGPEFDKKQDSFTISAETKNKKH